MLKKQQGTSRAFMVEDDAPKRRKFTRKTTNKTGQDGGHSGDVGLLYDDNLYLQDELVKSLDSIVKTLEGISNESNKRDRIHKAYHALLTYVDKQEKFPRVGCMPGYHSHPGKRGCHKTELPHRNATIAAMGGVEAYQRVHPAPPPQN